MRISCAGNTADKGLEEEIGQGFCDATLCVIGRPAAGCDPDASECLSEQNRRDIIAYMQLLSFEGEGLRPARAGEGR